MAETNVSSLGPDKKGDATSTQPNVPVDVEASAISKLDKPGAPAVPNEPTEETEPTAPAAVAVAAAAAAAAAPATPAAVAAPATPAAAAAPATPAALTAPAAPAAPGSPTETIAPTGMQELTESDAGRHATEHQNEIRTTEKPEVELSPAELREYRIGRADGLVGIFVLTALLLGYGALCWWKSYSPLNPPQRFSVVFRDVASLNYQAPVFVDGVRVGSVDKIQIRGSENVLVGLKVNTQKIAIPTGSRFIILPNGVVGAKYIEIILPENATAKNTLPLLTEKSVVQGDDPIRPEIVVNELVEKLSTIDFSDIENKLSRNMDKLGNVADHVSTLSTKMEPVAAKAQIAVENVSALSNDMRAPVQQMHQILDQRHPLMHMMFGRPGHIKEEKTLKDDKGTVVKQTTKVDKASKDNKDTDSDSDEAKKKHHFWKL